MIKVSAVQLQREFGRIRAAAHKSAVTITNHGRDDLVLLAAEEYERLRALDQQAFYVEELPGHIINELSSQEIPQEAHQYDHEFER